MTGNTQQRHIIYVCRESKRANGIDVVMEQLSAQLDVKFARTESICELMESIGQFSFNIDLVVIEAVELIEAEGSTVFDIVNTLSTLMRYHRLSVTNGEPSTNRPAAIAVGVSADTDIKIVRELLTVDNISGLYPSGFGYTLENKVDAVRDFLAGDRHIPKAIKQSLVTKLKAAKAPGGAVAALTPRQSQIFNLVTTRGSSNKTIANLLHITDSTVKLHMTAILKKCGVRTRTQLAVFTKDPALTQPVSR